MPLVATRFVANKRVVVPLLKTAVEDTVAPRDVPLIVPPEIATLWDANEARFAVIAFKVVPEAVANPNHPVEVTFVKVALVNAAFVPLIKVANKLVAVALVKTPVEGVTFPIGVPFTEPPVIVAFEELSATKLAFNAFNVDPEAVAKPNQPVDVTLVNTPLVAANVARFKVVPVALVKINCVAVAAEKTAVPPSKFTLFAFKFKAVKLEPDAVAKLNQLVEVTLLNEAVPPVICVATKFPVEVPPAN